MARASQGKEYGGSAYIGVVGPDIEYGQCRDSIQAIARRAGDEGPFFIRATKGYEARQMHLNKFMDSRHGFLLLLDHDMTFPQDTLERLRSHGKPYVSGFYLRRQYKPIAPVWYRDNPRGLWPHEPYTDVPEGEGLVKLGASGWGCLLVHREVIEATREILKGEDEIIEDDMDIWPYDLDRVEAAIQGLVTLVSDEPTPSTLRPALAHHTKVLREEIRPLRIRKDVVGSDIRFPYYAKAAGFQLYGDPMVQCGHMLDYPLAPTDFTSLPEEVIHDLRGNIRTRLRKARREINAELKQLGQTT